MQNSQDAEARLFDQVAAQRSVINDLYAEIAQLKEEVQGAKQEAEHWRAVAAAAVEKGKMDVAAAKGKAERQSHKQQQSARWATEDADRRAQRDAEHLDRQLDMIKQHQLVEAELKRKIVQLTHQRDGAEQKAVTQERMKRYYKQKAAATSAATAESNDIRRELEAEIAHADGLRKDLQAQVDALRVELECDLNDNGEHELRLLKPGHTRQFNDKAFELARCLVLLGIPVAKIAPAINAILMTLGVKVDKLPTITVCRTAQAEGKVLVTAHAHSRIAKAPAAAKMTLGHDASRKCDRDLMTVTVSQYYLDDDGGMQRIKTVLPFGQQSGGTAKEEADAVVNIIALMNELRPEGTDALDILATADAVISDQASTAVTVGKELGFKMETSFPCGMHACQNQSLVLLEAIDDWAQDCLHVDDDITASDEVLADENAPKDSKFGVFVWEYYKLFLDKT